MLESNYINDTIIDVSVRDIRFPTSLNMDGSDAMHVDPDYSCTYVVLYTENGKEGVGLTFTIGRGNELVMAAAKCLTKVIIGIPLHMLFGNFAKTWRTLVSDSQLRWVGPEKGVIHLATAAVVNALWDLWSKAESKPMWKFLVDMTPQQLVSTIDFTHIKDVLTEEEAVVMLTESAKGKEVRERQILDKGYPAYITAAGWLGYSEDKIRKLCSEYLSEGWTAFKVKVGQNVEEDRRRCAIFRQIIGDKNILMVDANQKWEVNEAISWMEQLAEFKPLWIEEPTSPDDIIGHAKIAKALKPLGIGVATGEMCHNRVMFKQFLETGAMNYCQIDAARLGGVPEVLSVYLMAKKFHVPVCPHAGGIGLCEMVQHLQIWDYISLSGSMENRLIEYVDHLIEHMQFPRKIANACYLAPKESGYNTDIKEDSLNDYQYPGGKIWQQLFKEGKFSP